MLYSLKQAVRTMNDKDKKLIDEKVFKVLIDMARLYKIDPTQENLKFGIAMFREGIGFVRREMKTK